MIKALTENMPTYKKNILLDDTFNRLHFDRENEDFADVIIELAAEINLYKIQKEEMEKKMQLHDDISAKMLDGMKQKMNAKDPAPLIKIEGDVMISFNRFAEAEGDCNE